MPYNLYQDDPRFPIGNVLRRAPGDEEAYEPASSLAALLPKPDPEMDERWRAAEQMALRKSQPSPDYGVAEGVRDLAPMAIGSILDILVNKGRGLGTLAAGGMQALSSEQSRRDAAQKAAAAQALAIRQQRESGADRAINAEHAMLRRAELDQRIAEMRRTHPELTREQQEQKAQADLELEQAQVDKTRAEAYSKWLYPEQGGAFLGAQRFDYTKTQDAKQEERQKQQDARQQKQDERQGRLDAERKTEQEQVADERKGREHTRRFDLFNQRTAKIVPLAQAMRQADTTIADLRAQNPDADIPGTGLTGRAPFILLSPEGKTIRIALDNMREFQSRKWSGANIPKHEQARMDKALSPGASDEDRLVGLDIWRKFILGEIRRHGKAVGDDVAQEALDATEPGLYDYVQDPSSIQPPKPTGPTMVSPDAPARIRGVQPSQEPQPSAAPQTSESAGGAQEWGALWAKIPPDQQAAVGQRLAALPENERLEALRKLANGVALEPGLDVAEPYRPSPQPARPQRNAPPKAAPPSGAQPEPYRPAPPSAAAEPAPEAVVKPAPTRTEHPLSAAELRKIATDDLDITDEQQLQEYSRRIRLESGATRGPHRGEPTDQALRTMPEDQLDPTSPRQARELKRRAEAREATMQQRLRNRGSAIKPAR